MNYLDKKFLITEETAEVDNEWTEFISGIKSAAIYHHPSWFKILEEETGHKVIRLICRDNNGNIAGVLPLQFTKGFPFGLGGIPGAKRLSSLPRTPIGGPIASDKTAAELLIRKSLQLADENKDRLLQIKSFDNSFDDRIDSLKKYFWREIYISDIPAYPDEIRFGNSKNHTTIKWAVNKAAKSGVTVRYTDSIEDLFTWYKLFVDTMRYHITPVRSIGFFKNLWHHLKSKNLMKLAIAEIEYGNSKKIIAGSIFFFYNKTVTYAFNGSSRKDFELRPNDLIHWTVFHDAQKNGFEIYDWGEVSKNNEGLASYKKKWGSRKLDMYHYYYPKSRLETNNGIDSENTGELKKKLWNLLPLKVTTLIGENVYKRL